ncbi:MAG: hypothetical protein MJZ64_04130 [Paludibacteraceae bacterium]|nr:hypothetical protein [Paludibacteraceae bacterium]
MISENANMVSPSIPSVAETMMGMGGYAYKLEMENKQLREQLYEYEHPLNRPSMKVVVEMMMAILKNANITQATTDRSKIARAIAFVSGFSERKIYECIADGKPLASCHEADWKQAQKLLSELTFALPEKSEL